MVRRPQDWRWSTLNEYSGMSAGQQKPRCGLIIDRVRMPSASVITSKPALRAGHANLVDRTLNEKLAWGRADGLLAALGLVSESIRYESGAVEDAQR
jgi:hypothetical protein